MVNCDNCINTDRCGFLKDRVADLGECQWFTDKSKYFEMPPCKMGDFVWAIREYGGVHHAQQGKIREMFFTKDMDLMIVVSHIARGYWGEKIFATQEEAEAKIRENQEKEKMRHVF